MLILTLLAAATAGTPQPGTRPPKGAHAAHLEAADLLADRIPATPATRAPPPPGFDGPDVVVYGYHAYWSGDPADVDLARLTHLAVFNVDLSSDGTLDDTDNWTDHAAGLVPLAHGYGVSVHVCVTSFDEDVMESVLSSSSRRATAVSALAALVNDYGADGVNVDFEGLPYGQKDEFVAFIQELKAAVPEVVLAMPAVDWNGSYDYDALAAASDGLFIMGYGYHWSGGDPGPNAPLYGGDPWSDYSLQWSVEDYLTWGATRDKIILGLPLYGHEWSTTGPSVPGDATSSGQTVFMHEAVSAANATGSEWDAVTHTPYLMETYSQTWYDDTASIRDKIAYAVDEGLQGVGFWALEYEGDDPEFWDMVSEETDLSSDDTGDPGGGEDNPGVDDPPVALAGLPLMAYPGDTIILDGSPSYDPEGAPLTYAWVQVAGPAVAVTGDDTASPQFTVEEPGVHSFRLVVNDGVQDSSGDVVDVIVVDPDAGDRWGEKGGCDAAGLGGAGGLALAAAGLLRRRRLKG